MNVPQLVVKVHSGYSNVFHLSLYILYVLNQGIYCELAMDL